MAQPYSPASYNDIIDYNDFNYDYDGNYYGVILPPIDNNGGGQYVGAFQDETEAREKKRLAILKNNNEVIAILFAL